jgi:exopolysaccharide production protein ExoY
MFRSHEDFADAVAKPPQAIAQHLDRRTYYRLSLVVKRLIDIVGALCFLVLFLPMYVAVAAAVRLSSKGPIIYSQERIGLHGRSFRFYKFRSMVMNGDEVLTSFLATDAEARDQWKTFQKLDHDPRITSVGHFIRRTSLDEFPQLWNVLKGDMSLVGPRPCMPSQKNLYGRQWAAYCAVRPGVTGLWQVSGRNRLTYEQRVQLDGEYVRNWSLSFDIKILARTISVVLTGHGSR